MKTEQVVKEETISQIPQGEVTKANEQPRCKSRETCKSWIFNGSTNW